MAVRIYKGFHPLSYQKAVTDILCTSDGKNSGRIVTVKAQRQRGKSFMIANVLLYYGINFKKTKNYYVAPTLKQSKEIFKTIVDATANSGVIKSSNATDLFIRLINGSSISFKSAEQKDNLRGFTCTGILCVDECAYISDDVINIILPWVDWYKAPMLVCSTPFVKSGKFWEFYNYGLTGVEHYYTVDWTDKIYEEDMLRVMPLDRLSEYERQLPKNVFKSDYLGEFLDDDGSVFTDFKKCVKMNVISPTDRLYGGIDWGTGNGKDDTVLSLVNQYGKQVYLDYFNTVSPTEQVDRIYNDLFPVLNQIVLIQPELNSLGTPMTDMLKKRSQVLANKIRGFNTTNKSKNDIVTQLQVGFEQDDLEILPDDKQLNELSTYTAEYNLKTKTITYNAPNGLNDDICIALMLSYDAYKTSTSFGVYALR